MERKMEERNGRRGRHAIVVMIACLLIAAFAVCALSGCGSSKKKASKDSITYGTTSYNKENEDGGLDPHNTYMGWSCVRYGVGETLFKFDENMDIQPWIAESYQFTDDTTVVIKIKDNVTFSNGRKVDGAAVKACLEDLVAKHDRAPSDLKIASIAADGQTVTIKTTQANPAIVYYLSDPYGAIIDMDAGVTSDNNVVGTGPYRATSVSDTEIQLEKNDNYWNGKPTVGRITVKSITDGDTLNAALQSGEIDAAYGMPYADLGIYTKNTKDYRVSSTSTSRVYQAAFNYDKTLMQDPVIRKAICMSLNSSDFVNSLLEGHGATAVGCFPSNFRYAVSADDAVSYDPEAAKALLAADGWADTDGDGYLEKGGQKLEISWLTYPSRQELPKLAEYAQAQLKNIGVKVNVNSTSNHKSFVKADDFDVYASAIVTAPQGDPQYYFTSDLLPGSSYDAGHYDNDTVNSLVKQLSTTFDTAQRAELAKQVQKEVLKDNGVYYASFLQMSIVTKGNVSGLDASASDYYEITAGLTVS